MIALIARAIIANAVAIRGIPIPITGLKSTIEMLAMPIKTKIAIKKEKEVRHHHASTPPAIVKNSQSKIVVMVSKYLSMSLFYKGSTT